MEENSSKSYVDFHNHLCKHIQFRMILNVALPYNPLNPRLLVGKSTTGNFLIKYYLYIIQQMHYYYVYNIYWKGRVIKVIIDNHCCVHVILYLSNTNFR